MLEDYSSQQKKMVEKLEESFASGAGKSTVVKMQNDYLNDNQICLTSVAFLPEQVTSEISEKIIKPLKSIDPEQYYFPPESMHLTIKNIKVINNPQRFDVTDVKKADALFSEIIPKFQSIEFDVEDVILFPSSVSVMAYCNETLRDLVSTLDKGLNELGLPDDKKYLSDSIFWGNITVCRFVERPTEEFIEVVKKLRKIKIGKFRVEKINLISCNVVIAPQTKKIIGEYKLT